MLGHLESWHHQTSGNEKKNQKEYLRWTRKLPETKLCSRNLIKGINAWACSPRVPSIEDNVDASIQRFQDYIEKHEGGLITTIRNDTDSTMANRATITIKQKWEEKQICGRFKRLISNISHEKTWTWLRKGNFKRETESLLIVLYFDLRASPKILFQGVTPEGSDTFQWPVIERDRVGGLRLMIWDKVKVPLCHYSDASEESNLWTAWQLFPLDDV